MDDTKQILKALEAQTKDISALSKKLTALSKQLDDKSEKAEEIARILDFSSSPGGEPFDWIDGAGRAHKGEVSPSGEKWLARCGPVKIQSGTKETAMRGLVEVFG